MELSHKPKPPLYTQEGTVERQILDDSEVFFNERGENLRYGLVKRVFQWMLDTDDNGWFERTFDSIRDFGGRRFPIIRPSNFEIDQYIEAISNDVAQGRLTDELATLAEYLDSIGEVLPQQYSRRHRLASESASEHGQRAKIRLEYGITRDHGLSYYRLTRHRYVDVELDKNYPL